MPSSYSIGPGDMLGQYRIIRKIGEGGMGRVFEAVHQTIGRRAAIKLLLPEYASNAAVAARFLREAQAANRIQHPGVVQIFEFGQLDDAAPYFVMEMLEGETLDARIQRAAETPPGHLGLAGLPSLRQVAMVLAMAHSKSLVHRDLKPSNIMLVPDPDVPGGERAKVLDFGIVKALPDSGLPPTMPGAPLKSAALLGTPAYMPPEQWRPSESLDGKADVYALGVIAFQVLTGRVPFMADAIMAMFMMHMSEVPPTLHRLVPTLPDELATLVNRMLAKEPAARPSMQEVAAVLGRVLGLGDSSISRAMPVVLAPSATFSELPAAAAPLPPSPSTAFVPSAQPADADAITNKSWGSTPPPPSASSNAPTLPPDVSLPRTSRLRALGVQLALLLLLGGAYGGYRLWLALRTPPSPVLPAASVVDAAVVDLRPPPLDATVPPDLAAPPAPDLAVADLATPPPPKDPGTKPPPRASCTPSAPTLTCVRSKQLKALQLSAVLDSVRASDVKLCPGERLALSLSPEQPLIRSAPGRLSRATLDILLYALRGRFEKHMPQADVEIQCRQR